MVPQEVNGNWNKAKVGVAIIGSHPLSLLMIKCSESKFRGGEVTFLDTAMEKRPSLVHWEVTETEMGGVRSLLRWSHSEVGNTDDLATGFQ